MEVTAQGVNRNLLLSRDQNFYVKYGYWYRYNIFVIVTVSLVAIYTFY